jgi:hypothetical protein
MQTYKAFTIYVTLPQVGKLKALVKPVLKPGDLYPQRIKQWMLAAPHLLKLLRQKLLREKQLQNEK